MKEDFVVDYPSSELLLETAKIEYQNQYERANIIDNKINILVAIKIFFLGILINNLNMEKIIKQTLEIDKHCLIKTIIIFLPSISYVFIIFSFIYSIRALGLREYHTINVKFFNEINFILLEKNKSSYIISTKYMELIENNKKQNDSRAECFERSLIFISLSAIFFLISFVIVNII